MGRPGRGAAPDQPDNNRQQQLTTQAPSLWPYPYDSYAQIYRVAKFRLGMDPIAVEALYWWQFRALLGLDLPDGAGGGSPAEQQTRTAMAERAERLRKLAESNPDAAAERMARAQTRATRRERQRSDPAWREQVKEGRTMTKTADPSRVVKSDGPIDGITGDIVLVKPQRQ